MGVYASFFGGGGTMTHNNRGDGRLCVKNSDARYFSEQIR